MSLSKLVYTPLNYIGWGSLEQLWPEVEKYSPSRILLITDSILEKLGMIEPITSRLRQQGYDVVVFTDVVPEPPLEVGEKLVAYTREGNYELVIGVGGGSALDLAKLAAVLATHEGKVAEYLNLTGTKKLCNKGLPKILIPTTSGTGSEVTNIAVLSLETTKDVVTHDYLMADVAIVDPQLTVSVPPGVTAATGVDALTHAIEAYISVNANPITDGLALQAIRLISSSIRKAVKNGQDQQARIDMSYGSNIAGIAFFNAGVAGVHALAYPLGGQFHVSHGESNAVLLPYVMGYIRSSCTKRMADILQAMGGYASYLSEEEASRKCVDELERLVRDVGIPNTLRGFNIPESALESLAEDGIKQKRLLARSPLTLHKEDIRTIYQSAFDGIITEPEMTS
ncbi:iron-containing alcohol dehydrogenase [Paenibacillus radicis (ex Xue et al. 2023)]|uniref:Iron-containing alcohol dehydrogenase n=1 Tax=Paenibacillus radicis (ex Xue et al. 2023) TaxID=2972489 RepID=A0ABT1YKH5_9BACL|nr:iron-containing alcohol dehydrogenase [Paenibacillus radicis (ex Xue et al. 2023)]MCR8633691.1 iron-containing alcohol dehydrogenase [Paenibacillus radicis (ex Xue et al. 2023)]